MLVETLIHSLLMLVDRRGGNLEPRRDRVERTVAMSSVLRMLEEKLVDFLRLPFDAWIEHDGINAT